MNDEELTAEARRVARDLFAASVTARERLAAELLRQMADRLDALTPNEEE